MRRRDTAAVVGILALATLAAVLALYVTRTETPTTSPSPTVAAQTASPTATTPAPSPTERPTSSPQPGAITGGLGYPSEFIPALTVYAISTTDQRIWYSVDVPRFPPASGLPPPGTFGPGGGPRYTITGVAPGTYYVLAYRNDGQRLDPGLHSRRTVCRPPASGCPEDASLAPVTVRAGETTSGIDVSDWVYGAPGQPTPSIPPRPTPR